MSLLINTACEVGLQVMSLEQSKLLFFDTPYYTPYHSDPYNTFRELLKSKIVQILSNYRVHMHDAHSQGSLIFEAGSNVQKVAREFSHCSN